MNTIRDVAHDASRTAPRKAGKASDALGFLAWIALSFVAAAIGSMAQPGEWYAQLARPAWTPPDAVFAPVWTVLYMVWLWRATPGAYPALAVFVAQLGLNAAWSWLFFGWHLIGWALVEIVALLAAIVATIALFRRVSRAAALLLVPYAAWVTFAVLLNAAIWRLNS